MVSQKEEPRIITPFDESRVYVLNNSNRIPTYVMEVPGCRINDLPICLATCKKSEVPKVKAMCIEFARIWEMVGNGGLPGVYIK